MLKRFKRLGLRYCRRVAKEPRSWILAVVFLLLPDPSSPIPARIAPPVLRSHDVALADIAPYPVPLDQSAPNVSAEAAYVIDVDSRVPIYGKNQDVSLPPASTTKIMTALVALDAFGDDRILGAKDNGPVIGKTIHLSPREQLPFADLLYGLLLESGNDVALALGENYPGGYQRMVEAMNEKARTLGLRDTTFKNVSGIDEPGHLMSAHDAAILAVEAMRNDHFKTIVGTREKAVSTADGRTARRFVNTNELLGTVDGVLGVKTGTTENAGECLITFIERDGRRIVIVVLGSRDRFLDTRNLIEWAFSNHEWTPVF